MLHETTVVSILKHNSTSFSASSSETQRAQAAGFQSARLSIIQPQTNFTVRTVPEPRTYTCPATGALYLQRSSWRFCRGLLWTPWTPMSPAGPRRCSWPVCHPDSLEPRAGRRNTAARSSPTSSSLRAQSTVRTALPTGQPAFDLKSLKVWPCVVYFAFHTQTSLP